MPLNQQPGALMDAQSISMTPAQGFGGKGRISQEQLFADLHGGVGRKADRIGGVGALDPKNRFGSVKIGFGIGKKSPQKVFDTRLQKAGFDRSHFDHILAQDPDWAAKNPERAQAAIARQQHLMHEQRFQKFEDEALAFVNDKEAPETAALQAGGDVARSFDHDLAQGQAARRMSRRGMFADEDATQQGERGRDLMRAATMVTAKNNARSTTIDTQNAVATDLGNIGQGLSASAMTSLSGAAGAANQRGMANDAASSAAKQSMVTSTATGALAGGWYGMQAGTAVGGPMGALIGAGLGAALSYAGTGG